MRDPFSIRLNFPFLLGVQLAVSAIPDAFLLVDASDCAMSFTEIQKNHDLNSTLLDAEGFHRVFHTEADVHLVALDRKETIARSLRKLENSGIAEVLFVTSTPMTVITGFQYDKLIRELNPPASIPIIEIPRKGLAGDWLDGYSGALECLATQLVIPEGAPNRKNCAIVGYMMDRTEEDHASNIRELKRILEDGLALNLTSVWPGNSPFKEMTDIKNVGTIISFPYSRKAAGILAEKTGALLIETDLPIGLGATGDWINKIAAALGKSDMANDFITSELNQYIPRLEWAVPKWFAGRHINFCGDPYLLAGIKKTVEELGCSFSAGAVFSEAERLYPPFYDDEKSEEESVAEERSENKKKKNEITEKKNENKWPCEPGDSEFVKDLLEMEKNKKTDLFIANSIAKNRIKTVLGATAPVMELGYPSYTYHAFYDSPFMGYKGAMSLIQRMANLISG